jgi:hypothetical protein
LSKAVVAVAFNKLRQRFLVYLFLEIALRPLPENKSQKTFFDKGKLGGIFIINILKR